MTGIYAITHTLSGRVYIGCSVNIPVRWEKHRTDLNHGRHHSPYLQRAWTKHGAGEFEFTVIIETTREELHREERRLIRERQPEFNCMSATKNGPLHHDEATRTKMSQAQRRIWQEKRTMGLDQHTAEHKARIAAAATGRVFTDNERAKMSASARNRPPISEVTSGKLSASAKRQKGRVFTDEHKAKLRAARQGRKLSDEHKERIAEGLKQAYKEGRRGASSRTRTSGSPSASRTVWSPPVQAWTRLNVPSTLLWGMPRPKRTRRPSHEPQSMQESGAQFNPPRRSGLERPGGTRAHREHHRGP